MPIQFITPNVPVWEVWVRRGGSDKLDWFLMIPVLFISAVVTAESGTILSFTKHTDTNNGGGDPKPSDFEMQLTGEESHARNSLRNIALRDHQNKGGSRRCEATAVRAWTSGFEIEWVHVDACLTQIQQT